MTADTELQTPVFEVELFALDGDRLELRGHWSGVRGMRFIRPTLTLLSGDERRRLLASLDEKPWAPDEDAWVASFPWDGGDLVADGAELAVGPNLMVDLPAPDGAARRGKRADNGRFAASASESRTALTSARDAAAAERDTLRRELADAVAERDRLRAELANAQGVGAAGEEAAKRALTEAAAERDALKRSVAAVEAERDEARATVEAAQAAVAAAEAERDAALRAAKTAEKGRGEARRTAAKLSDERDELARQRDDAERDRDEARKAMTATVGTADDDHSRLRRALTAAEAQRDEAVRAARAENLDGLRAERDEAVQRATLAVAERTAALSARDDALRERDTVRNRAVPMPVTTGPPLGVRTQNDHPSLSDSWLLRITLAISVLVVLIVALRLLT